MVLALERALGDGTLVMPTFTADLTDPADWSEPPVPPEWHAFIRENMPAFEPDLTPTWQMGAIVESFRRQRGTQRSTHPFSSWGARGRHAARITADQSLAHSSGEGSPLARLYDLDAWILLLGVGHSERTVGLYVSSILNKLGARSRTEAAAIAVRRGLLRGKPG